ncbi:TetR/AcrR family transcriptional regulator [Treponema sp.]|uniref:TetR/AcrR family transcriptional regulator n=1 Tax=Treponema sp. TaxID=166 RepID=UPI00298E592A|nr:TetR/AcrR family transcriptional regulator [Treponema sp.]MCQ2241678.1 TetR/AcrR family transcriptional regulator [Treponema sp.]
MEQDEGRKSQILNIAMNLFAQKGYDGVGVQEICQQAEITKPTLYYYFGSKAGILEEIASTYGNRFCQLIENAAEYEHDFTKSITRLYQDTIKFASENTVFFRLHNSLINAPENSEAKSIYTKVTEQIKNTIRHFFELSCQELGNMRGKEILYATLFTNSLFSVSMAVLAKEIEADDQIIYQLVHSFMYGIVS